MCRKVDQPFDTKIIGLKLNCSCKLTSHFFSFTFNAACFWIQHYCKYKTLFGFQTFFGF